LNDTASERVAKIPLLGDIPILGHLFRRTTTSQARSELAVLITPHIVRPEPDEAMRAAIGNVEEQMPADEGILMGSIRSAGPDAAE